MFKWEGTGGVLSREKAETMKTESLTSIKAVRCIVRGLSWDIARGYESAACTADGGCGMMTAEYSLSFPSGQNVEEQPRIRGEKRIPMV